MKGEPVSLTRKEFDTLKYLMEHKGTAVTRDKLMNEVWGYDYFGDSNIVDVYIRYLRHKIDDQYNIKTIKYWTNLPDDAFNMGALQERWTEANMRKPARRRQPDPAFPGIQNSPALLLSAVQEFYSRCADSDRCFLLLHRDTRFRGAEGNAAASGNADGGNPGGTG